MKTEKRLIIANSINFFGDWLTYYTLGLYIYAFTGSSLNLVVWFISAKLPYFLFTIFSGDISDRLSKKKIMIFSDTMRCLASLSFIFFMNKELISWVYPITFIRSSLACFYRTAAASSLP